MSSNTRDLDSQSDCGSEFSDWTPVSATDDGSQYGTADGTTAEVSLLDDSFVDNFIGIDTNQGDHEPNSSAEPSAEYLSAESRFPVLDGNAMSEPSAEYLSAESRFPVLGRNAMSKLPSDTVQEAIDIALRLTNNRMMLPEHDRKLVDEDLELPALPSLSKKELEELEEGERTPSADLTMPSMPSVPCTWPPAPPMDSVDSESVPRGPVLAPAVPSTPYSPYGRSFSTGYEPDLPHNHYSPSYMPVNRLNASPPSVSPYKKTCKDCGVEQDTRWDFPSGPLTEACGSHGGPNTCNSCLKKLVGGVLRKTPGIWIGCPEGCGPLPYETIVKYAPPEMQEQCEMLRLYKILSQDKDFVWCSAFCKSGQIHEGGASQPIVTCMSCGKKTCFYHKTAWHAGVTCDEFDRYSRQELDRYYKQKQEEEEDIYTSNDIPRTQKIDSTSARAIDEIRSENVINRTTKPCPCCGSRIEKAGGCAHMTCFNCLYSFCWECSADYDLILRTDNTAHKESCRLHTKNLDMLQQA